MAYAIELSSRFERSLLKLRERDRARFEQVRRKLLELVEHPERFKPLRNVLAGYRRLHFGPFVLIYTIEGDVVRLIALDHHDRAY